MPFTHQDLQVELTRLLRSANKDPVFQAMLPKIFYRAGWRLTFPAMVERGNECHEYIPLQVWVAGFAPSPRRPMGLIGAVGLESQGDSFQISNTKRCDILTHVALY
jgi:hypothetical protein